MGGEYSWNWCCVSPAPWHSVRVRLRGEFHTCSLCCQHQSPRQSPGRLAEGRGNSKGPGFGR